MEPSDRDQMSSTRSQFARLLEAVGTGPRSWTAAELEPMWQHFRHSNLTGEFDLELGTVTSSIATWSELIQSSNISHDALISIKNAAKRAASSELPNLPPPIARMVYHATLALANIRQFPPISSLSLADLRAGWKWASQQEWIDSDTRAIFVDALNPSQTDPGKPGNRN